MGTVLRSEGFPVSNVRRGKSALENGYSQITIYDFFGPKYTDGCHDRVGNGDFSDRVVYNLSLGSKANSERLGSTDYVSIDRGHLASRKPNSNVSRDDKISLQQTSWTDAEPRWIYLLGKYF